MTIAEVSRAYDISADTLRYYERVGLLPSIGAYFRRYPQLFRGGLPLGGIYKMYEKRRGVR